jgi:UDP-hydrolysing UDP-N-acetyl-D-glucosamine 2-epimerase
MGEDPRTVHVVGAPGLDNMRRADLASRDELEGLLGVKLAPPVVLVTVHPATLAEDAMADVRAVCAAMDRVEATYVVTLPNSDPGNEAVRAALLEATAARPRRASVDALGERRYWGLMRQCDAMLGNSSSGLIEAPALGLPVVNVGARQAGRLRGTSVIDAPPDADRVAAALTKAIDPAFRAQIAASAPLFGDGRSAEAIGKVLLAWTPPDPPVKRTIDRGESTHEHGRDHDATHANGGAT